MNDIGWNQEQRLRAEIATLTAQLEAANKVVEAAEGFIAKTGHVREGNDGAVVRVFSNGDALTAFGNLCDVLAARSSPDMEPKP